MLNSKLQISAVVLTKDEEKNIEECLKCLSWCDEVILIDDNSEDKTQEIAKKNGAKIFVRNLENSFAKQRNFGLEKAKGEWVLFLDADERISSKLKDEIKKELSNYNDYAGFYLKRFDVWKGKTLKHGEVGKIRLLRLAKKGNGEWERKVHEVWDIEGQTKTLTNPLLHYPHPTVSEFVAEIDRYSTLHAQEKFKQEENSSLLKIIFWPIIKFKVNYFWRLGFLDGTQGFLYAALMSFHSFLSWSKLWLMKRDNK